MWRELEHIALREQESIVLREQERAVLREQKRAVLRAQKCVVLYFYGISEVREVSRNLPGARGFVVAKYEPVASHGDRIRAQN